MYIHTYVCWLCADMHLHTHESYSKFPAHSIPSFTRQVHLLYNIFSVTYFKRRNISLAYLFDPYVLTHKESFGKVSRNILFWPLIMSGTRGHRNLMRHYSLPHPDGFCKLGMIRKKGLKRREEIVVKKYEKTEVEPKFSLLLTVWSL